MQVHLDTAADLGSMLQFGWAMEQLALEPNAVGSAVLVLDPELLVSASAAPSLCPCLLVMPPWHCPAPAFTCTHSLVNPVLQVAS